MTKKTRTAIVAKSDKNTSDNLTSIASRISAQFLSAASKPSPPGLLLVATPIGNLSDITIRALASLATCDFVYAEDTRHTLKLLGHFGIQKPVRPYHDHNAEQQRPHILASLENGARICLVSDAGTPLISDPGYKLVRECLAAGHRVEHLPGASSVLAALLPSGLPTDTFLFAGFLPARRAARRTRIDTLANTPAALVIFEAPSRLSAALDDLSDRLGPRQAAIGRELTKLNEEFLRGSLSELSAEVKQRPMVKGEVVLIVSPPELDVACPETIEHELRRRLADQSVRDTVDFVAKKLKVQRKEVYRIALKIERGDDDT